MEIAALLIAGLSVIIALYGAILSTYLWKQRSIRRLSIYLEFVSYYGRYRLQITNSGYRPVTVQDIALEVLDNKGNVVEGVPLNARFYEEADELKIPTTLKDGHTVTLNLSEQLSRQLLLEKRQLNVRVFDSDGNEYSRQGIRVYDGKWGGFDEVNKL